MKHIDEPLISGHVITVLCEGLTRSHGAGFTPELLLNPPWKGGWNKEGSSLVKRIATYLYKEKGVKLDNDTRTRIGNILAQGVILDGWYELDEVMMNDPGPFGDEDSCFYQSRRQVWPLLRKEGGAMLKLYSEQRAPLSRSLVLPDHDGGRWCFNAYGYYPLHAHASVLAYDYAVSANNRYLAILHSGLTAHYSSTRPIFINYGEGYLAGSVEQVDAAAKRVSDGRINVTLETDPFSMLCEMCDRSIDPLSWTVVERINRESPTPAAPEATVCVDCAPEATRRRRLGSRFWDANLTVYRPPRPRINYDEALTIDNSSTTSDVFTRLQRR